MRDTDVVAPRCSGRQSRYESIESVSPGIGGNKSDEEEEELGVSVV